MVSKIVVFGTKNYFSNATNVFDSLLNVASAILLAYVLTPNNYDSHKYVKYTIVLRLFRVLKLLAYIDSYRIIFKTFFNLFPVFKTLIGVLIVIFYIFSLLGVDLFGGKVYS